MTKTSICGSIVNCGDGTVSVVWFLTQNDAELHQEKQDEGWSGTCTVLVQTYVNSDQHKEAQKNSKELASKHEYLSESDYYESKSVGTKARSEKTCEHCGKAIPQGEPHEVHYFYPEFNSYPTHKKCASAFLKSLND